MLFFLVNLQRRILIILFVGFYISLGAMVCKGDVYKKSGKSANSSADKRFWICTAKDVGSQIVIGG